MKSTKAWTIIVLAACLGILLVVAGCPTETANTDNTKPAPTAKATENTPEAPPVETPEEIPADQVQVMLMSVPGLSKSEAAKDIQAALDAMEGVNAQLELEQDTIVIEYTPSQTSIDDLAKVVTDHGLTPKLPEGAAKNECTGECDGECDGSCEGDCEGKCVDEGKAEGEGCAEEPAECGSCAAPEATMPAEVPEGLTRVTIKIDGMNCNGKTGWVVKNIGELEGVAGIYPDAETMTAVMDYDGTEAKLAEVLKMLNDVELFTAEVVK